MALVNDDLLLNQGGVLLLNQGGNLLLNTQTDVPDGATPVKIIQQGRDTRRR